MKSRPVVLILIVCVVIAIGVTALLLTQGSTDDIFKAELDVNDLQRMIGNGESFLVYFYKPSCKDCLESEPFLFPALEQTQGLAVYKCERDANATVRSLYSVDETPTLIYFSGGQEAARLAGPLYSVAEYTEFLQGL